MSFLPLVKIKLGLIFLLLLASTFALSFAGRSSILIYREDDNHQEVEERRIHEHERILRMNSRDYGRSSPKPKFVRPPFKLIPN
ncbi:unnamed protein product [Arabis nemorensis]|uniref:Uncharacterized protein n=1 Tax=Arabis nemorensis TaxID=586526 RepID=A0A565C9Q1_9BRAS|nr:unnamed protein product [Arabis nemorensis]